MKIILNDHHAVAIATYITDHTLNFKIRFSDHNGALHSAFYIHILTINNQYAKLG